MIRRVFLVALFTGSSHLISLLTVSYILRKLGEETSGYIGLIDSTVMVVASFISFGVQLAVNRNAATRASWRSNYHLAQASRLALSLFIVGFGIGSYFFNWDITKVVYLFAPLIALNGDYALYGNGKPVHAASLSFIRVALPNLGVLLSGTFLGPDVIFLYIVLLAAGLLTVGLLSSKWNEVVYFLTPRKSFFKFYYKYLKVGLYQVASVLLITGVLTIAKGFYALATIGLIYGILKLYEIYKGGLRIIVQTFFKELGMEGVNEKIDKASLIAWGFLSIPTIFFFNATLNLLYDDKYDGQELLLPFFGIIMFFAAFRNSSDARILILRKDNLNLWAFLTALFVEVALVVGLSFTEYYFWGIPSGLLAAELILVFFQGIGLKGWPYFSTRLLFLAKQLPVFVVIGISRYLFGESFWLMGVLAVVYLSWVAAFNRRLIFDPRFLRGNNEA